MKNEIFAPEKRLESKKKNQPIKKSVSLVKITKSGNQKNFDVFQKCKFQCYVERSERGRAKKEKKMSSEKQCAWPGQNRSFISNNHGPIDPWCVEGREQNRDTRFDRDQRRE